MAFLRAENRFLSRAPLQAPEGRIEGTRARHIPASDLPGSRWRLSDSRTKKGPSLQQPGCTTTVISLLATGFPPVYGGRFLRAPPGPNGPPEAPRRHPRPPWGQGRGARCGPRTVAARRTLYRVYTPGPQWVGPSAGQISPIFGFRRLKPPRSARLTKWGSPIASYGPAGLI